MKESFIFYLSQYEAIKELTNEQLGRLMRAIFEKQLGNEVVLEDDIKIAFNFINNQMLVDQKKYAEICEKRSSAGKKGGAPKGNNNATKNKQTSKDKQNKLNDNENDNDIKENIKESDELSQDLKLEYNFGVLWNEYPRKKGKAQAFKHYKAIMRANKITNEDIYSAIDRYKEYIQRQKIQEQYIMHGSTFFCSGIYDYLQRSG